MVGKRLVDEACKIENEREVRRFAQVELGKTVMESLRGKYGHGSKPSYT
jgi:hypothetical protein